jgi:hypothetical protein
MYLPSLDLAESQHKLFVGLHAVPQYRALVLHHFCFDLYLPSHSTLNGVKSTYAQRFVMVNVCDPFQFYGVTSLENSLTPSKTVQK